MQIIWLFYCLFLWKNAEAVINNGNGIKNFVNNYNRHITINKVSLTQKGYIQFLRYITQVPPLTEYTFCIWVRSNNFNHSHPLLSYSKNENQSVIRVWISPHGSYINLEILGKPIFEIPINFVENHWYHVCQSWSAYDGIWALYLNGKLQSSGHDFQIQGITIPGGGEIVVGQEYTDFDKGLDDGIEGDVFGFNFVTSSAKNFGHYQATGIHDNLSNGLKLVALGFNCASGKGAPISGKDVVVSWTKTPVRVFGGAILKTISPFCI